MNKRLLAVVLLCAALMLSACQKSQRSAATKTAGGNPEEEIEETAGETADEYEADLEEDEDEVYEDDTYDLIAGTWFPDEGVGILTIYPNGGFLLEGDEASAEGYLLYTDEDGENGETGPRYEMYLENNERMLDGTVVLDDENPGKLVYTFGGDSFLLSRPDSVYDEDGVVVRAVFTDDDFLSQFDEINEYPYDEGEGSAEIAFCTERELEDFSFLSIRWVDSNEEGSFFSVEELYTLDALTPDRPLVVQISFPDGMPDTGISFTDADGETRYFAVLESGYDGSLVLSEFHLSEAE